MPKIEINLPATVSVEMRNGAKCDVDVASLPDNILEAVLAHGIGQKVRDSASGVMAECHDAHPDWVVKDGNRFSAKDGHASDVAAWVKDRATESMDATRDQLYAGTWATRVVGATSDPLLSYALPLITKAIANTPAKKAEYDAIPSDDQKARREFKIALWESLPDDHAIRAEAVAEKARADKRGALTI